MTTRRLRMGSVLPYPVSEAEGRLAFETRAIEALEAMAEVWEGELIVFTPGLACLSSTPRGAQLRDRGDLPFRVVEVRPDLTDLSNTPVDLLTGLLVPTSQPLLAAGPPVVFTAEVTYRIRLDIYRAAVSWPSVPRIAAGLLRTEQRLRRMVRGAAGMELNGPAAAHAYERLSRRAMTYMDHRLTSDDVEAAAAVPAWDGTRPLRVAFSGRHDAIKGPQHMVEVARMAHSRGLPVEFSLFGRGPLEEAMRAAATPNVQFRGFREFRSEWVPEVRQEVDLMMLPHTQGDPSCTYFESLGSGAPVLGFHNETLTPLVKQHGIGWAVRRGDTNGLLTVVQQILDDPAVLAERRKKGLALVAEQPFERLVRRRSAFFAEVARKGMPA